MKQNKKPVESSKKILRVSFATAIVLSIAVVVATFTGHDATGLTVVSGSAWAEVAAAAACYYTKAKAENRLKLVQSIVQTLSKIKRFEPDVLVQILDSIVKEG